MTLVILAATPVLAGVGIAIGIVMANLGKKASDAYAKASSIVAENLGNVRTVLAFNGADRAVKAYEGVRTHHKSCTSFYCANALSTATACLPQPFLSQRVWRARPHE